MRKRARIPSRAAALVAVLGATLLAAVPARADDPIPPILPTGSPSPSPSPPASPTATPKATQKPSPQPSRPPQPRGPAPDVYEGTVEEGVAYWMSLPKSPSRTTTTLLELLRRAQPPGVPLDERSLVRGVAPFPIAGHTWYMDDWAAPRYLPYFHLHEGNDLFAADGTPVIAVADGTIAKLMVGTIGGVSIWLRGSDGTVYYYGHLRDYAPGVRKGLAVKVGQVIGYVGNTGTAVDTPAHVHFELHPGGGVAVNPKPTLDRWLLEAEARAKAALQRQAELLAAARTGAARWRTVFGLLAQPPAPRAAWLSGALDGGSLAHADRALERIAMEADRSKASTPIHVPHHEHETPALSPVLIDNGILAGPHRPAPIAI